MEVTGSEVVSASDPAPYEEPYQRYLAAHETLRTHLPELGG
jgi:hypothetical protein